MEFPSSDKKQTNYSLKYDISIIKILNIIINVNKITLVVNVDDTNLLNSSLVFTFNDTSLVADRPKQKSKKIQKRKNEYAVVTLRKHPGSMLDIETVTQEMAINNNTIYNA